MNDIQLFNYEENAVRVIIRDGRPWWIAKDVCDILGYSNVTKALNDHLDDDERNTLTIRYGNRGNPNVNIINESGLYCLILRSNMPKAKQFRKWVTGTVIPQVMQYGLPEEPKGTLTKSIMYTARMILEVAGFVGNQLAVALDNVASSYIGQSLLALSGVTLVDTTKQKLLTPTEIGKVFGLSGRKVNKILCRAGYQKRVGRNYEPLEPGKPFAVILKTGRWHSDGTPIKQLKWECSFLTEIEDLFDGGREISDRMPVLDATDFLPSMA